MIPFEFLGPYRLGEAIGRGGMGTVYSAVEEKTGQPVAVKLIAVHVADDMQFRRRFAKEVETLKRLKHRNIVTLIGYGEQSGHLFYSMDLVKGESLQQKLRREKRLPWPLVLDMAIDICAALKHAHDFGVYHRDLKLANLLIDEDGAIKLVDFGIAKLFGSHDHTAAGSILGTAEYMAPEQADGGPITPRTDLYALGNVLYACFAGRPPFAGRALTRVIESLRQEEPVRIDSIAPGLPQEIAELIHDLLEKRPEDRPPTALAVMNRMKAIRAGLSRMASDLQHDEDTVAPTSPRANRTHAMDQGLNRPTAASAGDSKTLGQFDDGVTAASSPASDQLTVKATVPSELGKVGQTEAPGGASVVEGASERTHFRTVEDQDRHRSLWGHERHDEDSSGKLWHLVSIVALVAALLAGLVFAIWAMRVPTADELFQRIVAAQQSEDEDRLLLHTDRFMRLYPDDPRREDVAEYRRDFDARRLLAQLHRKAANQIPPEQQALEDAIVDVQRDPQRTRTRLQHWLDVYGHEEVQGDDDAPERERPQHAAPKEMVRAAQLELQRLAAGGAPPRDQRIEALVRRIAWSRENLPVEDQHRLLRGILALYGDEPWAQPAIAEAQRRLAEIEQ